jgi:tetratricopeptide (TPR) repeat protein
LAELGEKEAAVEQFSELIEAFPQKFEFLQSRARLLWELKDVTRALADLDKAIGLNDRSWEAFYARAQLRFAANGVAASAEAIDDLNMAIELDPDRAELYLARGTIQRHGANDSQQALSDFNEAIRLNPGSAEAYRGRAEIYLALNQLESAMGDANLAIQLAPNSVTGYLHRARAYKAAGDLDKAREDVDHALKIRPTDQRALDLSKTLQKTKAATE